MSEPTLPSLIIELAKKLTDAVNKTNEGFKELRQSVGDLVNRIERFENAEFFYRVKQLETLIGRDLNIRSGNAENKTDEAIKRIASLERWRAEVEKVKPLDPPEEVQPKIQDASLKIHCARCNKQVKSGEYDFDEFRNALCLPCVIHTKKIEIQQLQYYKDFWLWLFNAAPGHIDGFGRSTRVVEIHWEDKKLYHFTDKNVLEAKYWNWKKTQKKDKEQAHD